MITKTFETDQEAQLILKQLLPKNWLYREQHPDFHIDYYVEVAEDDLPSGLIFAVQLKGTRNLQEKHGIIKIKFEVSHLIYFLDKVKVPVYIIVCDVERKVGYWLFIQKYLRNLHRISWRNQKRLTLKIPTSNDLTNTSAFLVQIKSSEIYVRDLFPSSIPAAISNQMKRFQKLDPRIEMVVHHSGSNTSINLKPKEKIDFKLLVDYVKVPEIKKKFDELNNSGKPVEINVSDLKIEGSDLLTELIKEADNRGKITFKPKTWQGSVFLETQNKGKSLNFLYGINGEILINKNKMIFEGELAEGPFKISIEVPSHTKNDKLISNITVQFDLNRWVGKQLVFLPFRDRIYYLIKDMLEEKDLKIFIDLFGNNLFQSYLTNKIVKEIKPTFDYFELIYKAAKVASHMKLNPILPHWNNISDDEWSNINILYDLITRGEYHQDADGTQLKIKMLPIDEYIDSIQQKSESNNSVKLETNAEYSFFGQIIKIDNVHYAITNAKLITDLSKINLKEDDSDEIQLVWEGQNKSEIIISAHL